VPVRRARRSRDVPELQRFWLKLLKVGTVVSAWAGQAPPLQPPQWEAIMTRWYWAKIVLGMLAIFVVGMVGANVMSAGKEKATRFVASDASITLPMFGMPFMLEGSNIGKLKRLKIERSAPESVRAIHLTAELDSDAVLQKLATCQISLDDFDTIDENSTFVCVEPVDS